VGTLIALTDAERVALIAGTLAIFAGVPGAIAAIITARTRKENTDQHGESQRKLGLLIDKIDDHGDKIDDLKGDVQHIAHRVDHAHDRIDRINPPGGRL
jgi:hypothetical protein